MYRMINRSSVIGLLVVGWGLLMGTQWASGAQTPEEFYRGKTIKLISTAPGDATDLIGRTIAPFLNKDIGSRVIIENKKTDAAMNYVYKEGTRDGLTLAIISSDALIMGDILKAPGVIYETDKFLFIADVYPSVKVVQISPKLPFRTLDGLRKAKGLRGGGTSARGSIAVSTAVMFEILGLDGKVISGFPSKKDLILALAKGETDLTVTSDNSASRDEKDGYIVNLLTTADKRSQAIPHVPSLSELGVVVPKELEAVHKAVASGGTSVAFPPNVPPERVEYLRKTFQHLSNNPDLKNGMERLTGVKLVFVPGQEVQKEMIKIKSDKELAAKLGAIFKKYSAVR